MKYIYARVSTNRQQTENQTAILKEHAPDAEIIYETVSGAKKKPALDALLERLGKGDEVYIYKIDRLGRKASEVLDMMERIKAVGATLIPVTQSIADDSSGDLLKVVLAGVSEFERKTINERIKAALARAKANGKKLGGDKRGQGRKPVWFTSEQFDFLDQARLLNKPWISITYEFNYAFKTTYRWETIAKKYRRQVNHLQTRQPSAR